MIVRKGEREWTIESKRESGISPETRRLLAHKASDLYTNKLVLIADRGKVICLQLPVDKKEIQKVSVAI